jgi:hypothetical protein
MRHFLTKPTKILRGKEKSKSAKTSELEETASQNSLVAPLFWTQRLKRVFNIDNALCPLCGGAMRIIDDITEPDLLQKIQYHLAAQPFPIKPTVAIQS